MEFGMFASDARIVNSDTAASGLKALWQPWVALWNGDFALLEQIIAVDFLAHAAPISGSGPDEIVGRQGLAGWISGIRAAMPDLLFSTQVGPLAEGEFLSGRWSATGTYRGGMPGIPATAVGSQVSFSGTDTLRIAADQIAEYWANADMLQLMLQLGALAPANQG
jgi:predicted ester cyclase